MTKATFLMVQGMPSSNKFTPAVAVRVLIDCKGNAIACDYSEYGKEQNIGLHNVVSLTAMARVTATVPFVPTRAQTIELSTTTCICTSGPYSCADGPAAIMCICSPKR